jgi:peroxiredoxin
MRLKPARRLPRSARDDGWFHANRRHCQTLARLAPAFLDARSVWIAASSPPLLAFQRPAGCRHQSKWIWTTHRLKRKLAAMAETSSTMLALGTPAPEFALPDTSGKIVSLADFKSAPALLVMFICNHCPYVKHAAPEIVRLAKDYQPRGIAMIAINANDAEKYPADSPSAMGQEVKARGYTFPYLYDETQRVAKTFRAACTPEFYLFDGARKLVYRGRLDGSTPGNAVSATGAELRAALDALLTGKPISEDQKPGIGCNIKWKTGNEPDYFGRRE